MNRRSGFTLLELLLAIVVTSLVAMLVYGTVQVGLDARERVAVRLATEQSRRAARLVLVDALRNASPPSFLGDSVFTLEDRRDAAGRPAARLSFRTAGGLPPLTPDSDWLLTLEATDSGATLSARPAGTRLSPRLVAHLGDVVGVEVNAQRQGGPNAGWTRDWHNRASLPAAVSVTFWTRGGPVEPALLVPLPNGGAQ